MPAGMSDEDDDDDDDVFFPVEEVWLIQRYMLILFNYYVLLTPVVLIEKACRQREYSEEGLDERRDEGRRGV